MKTVSHKLLAVLLIFTVLFTMSVSVCAYTTENGKITPACLTGCIFKGNLAVGFDGDFVDFKSEARPPVELWTYDKTTDSYIHRMDFTDYAVEFNVVAASGEDIKAFGGILDKDFTGFLAAIPENMTSDNDCYKLVFPADLFVTADGVTNNAFETVFKNIFSSGSNDNDADDSQPTVLDKILDWFRALPPFFYYILRPVMFFFEILHMIFH